MLIYEKPPRWKVIGLAKDPDTMLPAERVEAQMFLVQQWLMKRQLLRDAAAARLNTLDERNRQTRQHYRTAS